MAQGINIKTLIIILIILVLLFFAYYVFTSESSRRVSTGEFKVSCLSGDVGEQFCQRTCLDKGYDGWDGARDDASGCACSCYREVK